MIPTKQSQQHNDKPKAEVAAVAGKIYNPLNGSELRQLLVNKVRKVTSKVVGEAASEAIGFQLNTELRKFSSLDSDVIGFPKADVKWKLELSYGETRVLVSYALGITQFPQEEARGFSGEIYFYVGDAKLDETVEWSETFNCDTIPPDRDWET